MIFLLAKFFFVKRAQTPLHKAAYNDFEKIVEIVLIMDQEIHLQDKGLIFFLFLSLFLIKFCLLSGGSVWSEWLFFDGLSFLSGRRYSLRPRKR